MSRERERAIPPVREWRIVPPITDCEEMRAILKCGETHLDALLAEGLPHLNIGFARRAGKHPDRTRRMLRFEPAAVLAWLRQRNGGRP